MNLRPFLLSFPLLAVMGLSSATAQQRVEFQRQKFDRSRFERPDPTARPPMPGPATAAPSAPMMAPAEPAAPAPSAPAAMVTERPSGSIFSTNSTGSEFSSSGSGSVPSTSAAATTPTNTAIFSADATLPSHPPGGSPYPATATPEEKAVIDAPLFDQLPAKDFNNPKDHDDLVALQKKTGACMIVYFKNPSVPNEKGLCSWFEKSVTTDIKWRKAMKFYLQLEINLPGNSVVEDLIAKYRVGKTPAVFVVKPGSTMPVRLKLFDYPAGSRPVPIEAALVLDALKAGSTPAYQTLF
jgi:hypothetical protein